MAAEGQPDGGEGSALGEHFRDLRGQVGRGSHQHLAQVPPPRGGLLRRPGNKEANHQSGTRAQTRGGVAEGAAYTYFSFWVSNLKMCTVSVLLEADRYRPSMLNASEQMLTHLDKSAEGHMRDKTNTQTNRLATASLPFDSSPELKELLALWDGEDANDCSLRGGDRDARMRTRATAQPKKIGKTQPIYLLRRRGQFRPAGVKGQSR